MFPYKAEQSAHPVARGPLVRLFYSAAVVSSLALGACTGGMSNPFEEASLTEKPVEHSNVQTSSIPQTELQKATEYWGKQYEKDPKNAQAAINYVRNLKALGAKPQALQTIQQAYSLNPNDRGVASEYGRLAFEQDQVSLAEKLLAQADDPLNPDWKVISARGAVLAKQGRYREAIPHFERALALAPTQASVLNNLALAHAMDGHAEKAEPMLRQAAATQDADPRVGKNLALVLGLQGKTSEARDVVLKEAPDADVEEDASYVKEMVGAAPGSAAAQPLQPAKSTAKVRTGSLAPNGVKGAAITGAGAATTGAEAPALLVQRLADSHAADAPIQLAPKE